MSTSDLETEFLFLSLNQVHIGTYNDFREMPVKTRKSLVHKLEEYLKEQEDRIKRLQKFK